MHFVGMEPVTWLVKASGEIISNCEILICPSHSASMHQNFTIAIILMGVWTSDFISNFVNLMWGKKIQKNISTEWRAT